MAAEISYVHVSSLHQNSKETIFLFTKPLPGSEKYCYSQQSFLIQIYMSSLSLICLFAENMRDAADFGKGDDWTFQGIAAGLYAVDSFFLLRFVLYYITIIILLY